MTIPVRLQLSRRRGFRLQDHSRAINGLPAVSVARPSMWGNPFTIKAALETGYVSADREFVALCFRDWLRCPPSTSWWWGQEADARRASILAALPEIRNHNLACWCQLPAPGEPDHCHAAVLLEIANR